jgi:hypothetical protein
MSVKDNNKYRLLSGAALAIQGLMILGLPFTGGMSMLMTHEKQLGWPGALKFVTFLSFYLIIFYMVYSTYRWARNRENSAQWNPKKK